MPALKDQVRGSSRLRSATWMSGRNGAVAEASSWRSMAGTGPSTAAALLRKSVCWNAPLVARCWANTSIGILATYDPALARTTVRPSPARFHASPSRGCRLLRSFGIRPSDGNRGSSR